VRASQDRAARQPAEHGIPPPARGIRNTGEPAMLVMPEYACGVYIGFMGPAQDDGSGGASASGALNTGTPHPLIAIAGMSLVPASARPIARTAAGNLHRVYFVRAHQNRVGMLGVLGDLVPLLREVLQPDLRDLIKHQDFEVFCGYW
jgi:hypothetical protein